MAKALRPTCIAMLAPLASAQAVLLVPATYPTIQAAIAAAGPGDTVRVAPGTYAENIDFLGKAIAVVGEGGAAVTTIDGGQAGSVVTFASSEPPAAVLDGFTLTNGRGAGAASAAQRAAAGGIQCIGASPTIRRCLIVGNLGGAGAPASAATTGGGAGGAGGLLAVDSSLTLADCEFAANVGGRGGDDLVAGFVEVGGRGGAGGAAFVFVSPTTNVTVQRCRFRANRGGNGGDATTVGSSAQGGRGGDGGIELTVRGIVRFRGTRVVDNVGGRGGTASGTGPTFAGSGGNGGFDFARDNLTLGIAALESCAVVGNLGGDAGIGAAAFGGAGAGATGATTFGAASSTFAGNRSGLPGTTGAVVGGVRAGAFMTSSTTLVNTIVWGNTRGGVPSDLDLGGIVASVQACDLGAVTGAFTGTGNLSLDPLFVDLPAGDVHLSTGSPCLHAGTAAAPLPLFDFDGDPRTVGPSTDIGADEHDELVGTRDDLTLALAVNGQFSPAVATAAGTGGDLVAVFLASPGGALAGDFALVAAELWTQPNPPPGPPALPELHLPLSAAWVAVYATGVGATGRTVSAVLPPGLAGFAIRMQAFCLSPAANNGVFAATAARDLVL